MLGCSMLHSGSVTLVNLLMGTDEFHLLTQQYVLSAHGMLGTFKKHLGAGDVALNKRDKSLYRQEVCVLVRKLTVNKIK